MSINRTVRHSLVIPQELAGIRLDQALGRLLDDYSRSLIKQWIDAGQVRVNDAGARPRDKTKRGDRIEVIAELQGATGLEPQEVAFGVVYADDDIVVIDKPAGVVVHPGAGNPDHTLVNGLLRAYPELQGLPRAGLVHRIDKETSGLLVVGRNSASYQRLVRALAAREISRCYEAIVHGVMISGGTVDAAIGRDPNNRTRMRISAHGRPAITHYRVKRRFDAHSHVSVEIETGRTHQIRVHLASRGHPIVGDKRYGTRAVRPSHPSPPLQGALHTCRRQALHAYRLRLRHPRDDTPRTFTAALPDDMAQWLSALAAAQLVREA